jgi:hypothetical protein
MIEKKTEIFSSGLYVFRYGVKILKLIIAETGYAEGVYYYFFTSLQTS